MPKRVVPDGPGKRVPVMTRTTLEMRAQLEVAASQSGRSLGQEVEHRLQQSFAAEGAREGVGDLVSAMFGSSHNAAFARWITPLIAEVEAGVGKPWTDLDADLTPYEIGLPEVLSNFREVLTRQRAKSLAEILRGEVRPGSIFGMTGSTEPESMPQGVTGAQATPQRTARRQTQK